jgi:uncharacterized membrane protein YgdD (TMEM256/DUF423 family)
MYKPALNAAFIFALIGVMVGAMGAHALRPLLSPDMQVSFETAVKYQFYHSFALAFTAALHMVFPGPWIRRATWAFASGIILFSGSIYLLVYLKTTASVGLSGLGILTPIGGIMFILGWLFLLIGINRRKKIAG